jgi:hypothetical protein
LNTSKSGRRPQNGLVIIAYSPKEIEWQPIVNSLENDGLEFVAHIDNSTTIALISSMGETYSKSRLEAIERDLIFRGFKRVTIEHCVEVNTHLRGKAIRMAEGIEDEE